MTADLPIVRESRLPESGRHDLTCSIVCLVMQRRSLTGAALTCVTHHCCALCARARAGVRARSIEGD